MSLYSRSMLINIQQCICYQSIYRRFYVQAICCSNIDLEPESMEIIMLKETSSIISVVNKIFWNLPLINVICVSRSKNRIIWLGTLGGLGLYKDEL